ncbi:MAG: ribonuclease III [Thermotogota bacterium]
MTLHDTCARAEELLGHTFRDRALLEAALTHPSLSAEDSKAQSYERLEFLGDSVLGLVVAEELFRRYPEEPEGVLTRRKIASVSGESLAAVGGDLGLAQLVRFGKGEARSADRGRATALENVVEALIGAVYVDAGLEAAREVVLRLLGHEIELPDIATHNDPKSRLQEQTQAIGAGLPEYRVVRATGPAHAPDFTVEVRLGDQVVGTGSGSSKKQAEKAAAAAALERMAKS